MEKVVRKFARGAHLWLGLITGIFVCLMGLTGGLVGLRPQIATLLSPSATRLATCNPINWAQAERDITAFDHSEINRVYGPYGSDTRYHFRMATESPILFHHVIYDACEGRVLGSFPYEWMDWTVDLHHNLLNGRVGRRWAGVIGIVMLISSLSGLLLWALLKPSPLRALRIHLPFSARTPRELHRVAGVAALCFLLVEAFTGIFLAFPQTLRTMVATVAPVAPDVRPPRAPEKSDAPTHAVGLAELMAAAHGALPEGLVREIRMPEGNGNAQIRMWLPGDFRSLGNNVVFVSGKTGQVLAVDHYSDRPTGNRMIQASAGLHYDEWGGLTVRILCAFAGLVTPVLYVTGILIWWSSRKRKLSAKLRQEAAEDAAVLI